MNAAPWSPLSMLQIGAGNVLAAAMLVAGWLLVDGGADLGSQVAWLNLSIAGLLVALWVNVRWLLDGRRAVGLRIRELSRGASSSSLEPRFPAAASGSVPSGALVAGDGLGRYHHSSCLLAAGKGWEAADAEAHRAAGRAPCGVCHP